MPLNETCSLTATIDVNAAIYCALGIDCFVFNGVLACPAHPPFFSLSSPFVLLLVFFDHLLPVTN